MPIRGNGTPAGTVPLDVLDAGQVDLAEAIDQHTGILHPLTPAPPGCGAARTCLEN